MNKTSTFKISLSLLLALTLLSVIGCSQDHTTTANTDDKEWEISVTKHLAQFDKEKLERSSPDKIWQLYLKRQNRGKDGFSEAEVDDYMKNYYYAYTKTVLVHSPTYKTDYECLYIILDNYNRYASRAIGGGTGFGHYEERLAGETNWIIISKVLEKEDISVAPLIDKIKVKLGVEPLIPYSKDIFKSRADYEKTKAAEQKEMEDEIQIIRLSLEKLKAENADLYYKAAKYLGTYY